MNQPQADAYTIPKARSRTFALCLSEQDQTEIERLHVLRSLPNALKIPTLYGLAVLTGYGIIALPHWYARVPLYLLMATIFAGIGVLMHEGAHGLLFRNKRLNLLASRAIATSLGVAFTQFRYAHRFHHAWTLTSEDRDRLFYLGNVPSTMINGGRALYKSTVEGLKTADRRHVVLYVKEMAVVVLLFASVLAVVLRQGWLMPFVHVYVIPFLLFPPLLVMRLLLEHYECDPRDDFQLSHTIISNPVVRFLWNDVNYHAVHHFWQDIPWYNLARAHVLVAGQLQAQGAPISSGYAVVLWRALREHGLRRPAYWRFPPPEQLSVHAALSTVEPARGS